MKKRLILSACFAGIGAALASGGIYWDDWRLYVVTGLASTIAIISEAMK